MKHHAYFFYKQLLFIPVFIASGIITMFLFFGIGTIILGALVEKDPNDNLSGMGEALINLFLSSAISVVVGIVVAAIVSSTYAARKFRLAEKDPEFSNMRHRWKCMQPYFLAVLGCIVLICILAAGNVANEAAYLAVGAIEIPVVVYLADKNLFEKYFIKD